MTNKGNVDVSNETVNEEVLEIISKKKPIYKKIWFWGIVAAVVVAIAVGVYFIFFNSTKPKYDENGKPVYVELTDNVYANADDYLGHHVSIKGIVFQVLGNSKSTKDVHVWLAPENSEKNVIIQYDSNVEINAGDYITCEGYIKSVSKFKNDFDTEIITPIIRSSDIKKITYMEAMRPTLKTVELSNAEKEQYKYKITVNKVEFAAEETRLYITVTNNGSSDFTVYEDNATIVQNGKQYDTQYNRDADYEEISHEIVKGAKSSGVITFPAIEQKDFKFIIEGYTPVYEEDLEEYIFNISMTGTSEQPANKKEEPKEENKKQNNSSKTPTIAANKNDEDKVWDAVVEYCNDYNWNYRTYDESIGFIVDSGTHVSITHSAYEIPESESGYIYNARDTMLNNLIAHLNGYNFPESITVTVTEDYNFISESEDYETEEASDEESGLTEEDGYWEDGYFYFYD